ncbi:MAG: GFA family protein [Acinetobacter sp.]|nr:GFA family protein [Acinetobacter sp.]
MKGQCLCQAVTLETSENHQLNACHCVNCRTWSGSAEFTFLSQGIKTDNSDHITHYPSSEWAERAFCKTCGTHLYVRVIGTEDYYVSAGLFNDVEFNLSSQIFIDHKANYYSLADDTPKVTSQEFFAILENGCK